MSRIHFLLVGVVAVMLVASCGRPTSAYNQFSSCQGLHVTSARHYDLDGVRVGITLISAEDTAVYYNLCRELQIASREQSLMDGEVAFTFVLRDRNDCHDAPTMKGGRVHLRHACLVAASEVEQTVYVIEDIGTVGRYQRIVKALLLRIQQYRGSGSAATLM